MRIWTATIALLLASPAAAAPTLRFANIHITLTSPTACDVTMALTVEDSSEIDHRIESDTAEILEVQGAQPIGELRIVGRTRSLVLQPLVSPTPNDGGLQSSYTLRYRSLQPDDRAYRCPIWLPAVPTDGISRTVRFEVDLPSSATPGGSMPAMAWGGTTEIPTRGTAMLGHVPAFVHLPYALPGESPGWSVAQAMDAAAIAVFVAASVVWAWRRGQYRSARSAR